MPGRKLYGQQAAERAGIGVSTWRNYTAPIAKRGGRLLGPPPDGVDVEAGHARPYWYEETVDAWLANRPGRGTRTDLHQPHKLT